MKFLLSVICCLFSVCSFSQFYIGNTERDCIESIYQFEGSNVKITKKYKDDGGFYLLWTSYVSVGSSSRRINDVVSFNDYGISYTFWQILDDVSTFNYFVKMFNGMFTKTSELEWNGYVKGRTYLIQARYVSASGDYAIYYTDITN